MKLLLRRVSENPLGSGIPEGNFFSEGFLETLRAVEFLRETSSPKVLRSVSGNPSGSGVPEGNFFSEGFLETLRAVEFLRETFSPKGFWKPFGQWSS